MDLPSSLERSSPRTGTFPLNPLSPSTSPPNASSQAVDLETRKLSSLAELALLPNVPIGGTTATKPSSRKSRYEPLGKGKPDNGHTNQSVKVVDQQPALDTDRRPTLDLSSRSAEDLSDKENVPCLNVPSVRRKTRSSMKTQENMQKSAGQSALQLGYNIRVLADAKISCHSNTRTHSFAVSYLQDALIRQVQAPSIPRPTPRVRSIRSSLQ